MNKKLSRVLPGLMSVWLAARTMPGGQRWPPSSPARALAARRHGRKSAGDPSLIIVRVLCPA
jgi:hypothetical protein